MAPLKVTLHHNWQETVLRSWAGKIAKSIRSEGNSVTRKCWHLHNGLMFELPKCLLRQQSNIEIWELKYQQARFPLCTLHFRYTFIPIETAKAFLSHARQTSSEAFSLLTSLDATKFVSLSAFTLMETNRRRIWAKPMPKNSRSPLPVGKSHSKTSLLKLSSSVLG